MVACPRGRRLHTIHALHPGTPARDCYPGIVIYNKMLWITIRHHTVPQAGESAMNGTAHGRLPGDSVAGAYTGQLRLQPCCGKCCRALFSSG